MTARRNGVRAAGCTLPAAAGDRAPALTVTGAHLWADRFDGSVEKVFELQDTVAVSVAGVIEPTLRTVLILDES
jgi:hypothetical protein